MGAHQDDKDATELKEYYENVMKWVIKLFPKINTATKKRKDWGILYNKYHHIGYSIDAVKKRFDELYGDIAVTNKTGIVEYILKEQGGLLKDEDRSLLNIRLFSNIIKDAVYKRQTEKAKMKGESNCPLCAQLEGPNHTKIWDISEMDADHVDAWSNGGPTSEENCVMLCKMHNRMKGNK